jgi:hypothetical protein
MLRDLDALDTAAAFAFRRAAGVVRWMVYGIVLAYAKQFFRCFVAKVSTLNA